MSVRGKLPGIVGIIGVHGLNDFRRLSSKIFLIHSALLIDNEGHHAGLPILRGPGNQSESQNHVLVHDELMLSAGRMSSLPRQNLKKIAMKWMWRVGCITALFFT